MFGMHITDWSSPKLCGWCRSVTPSGRPECLHCGRNPRWAWTKPLLTLSWGVGRLLLFLIVFLVVGHFLLALCPLFLAAPIYCSLRGSKSLAQQAAKKRR